MRYSIRYIDADGLMGKRFYTADELLDLARQHDPAVGDIGDALDHLIGVQGLMVVSEQS